MQTAIEQAVRAEDSEMVQTLTEVFKPLRYIGEKATFSARYEVDLAELSRAIDQLLPE